MSAPIELSGLYVYPVKSCAGIALERAEIDTFGLRHDREWMVIDATSGEFLTQRQLPAMARIHTRLTDDALVLSREGLADLVRPLAIEATARRRARVWGYALDALDEGDAAAAWLRDALDIDARLVRMPPDERRRVNPRRFPGEAYTALSDGYPLLLISEASLEDLNTRLPYPLEMRRFRPNLVVRGTTPYAEDNWRDLRIGTQRFAHAKPCERCAITTVDPDTGQPGRDGEPLRTLATYRRSKKGALFGVNLVHLDRGPLHLGDRLQPGDVP